MKNTPGNSRWWDLPSILLLFILVETTASRLVATTWTKDLYLVQTLAYIGFTVGMALGYSQFPVRVARLISGLYMLVYLPLQWTLIIDQNSTLQQQFASVFGRLYYSYSDFFARRPVEDPFLFVSLVTMSFWLLGCAGAFQLVRHQKFVTAVLPSAVILILIQNYDNVASNRIWIIAFFALLVLLLLGRLNYLENKESWKRRRIFVSPDNSTDLISMMSAAAALIIIFSWTPPASADGVESAIHTWNKITRPWRTFTQRMENAVNPLESPSGGKRGEFYGSELTLGNGFPLSNALMLKINAPPIPVSERPPRYYWRGRTYDYFVDGQWYTTSTTTKEYSPSNTTRSQQELPEEAGPQRFVFQAGDETFSLIYAPSQAVWVSRPGSTFTSTTDSEEIISWFALPNLLSGETYMVDVELNNPNIQQLNEAGMEYPIWVTDQYLQLPQNFSPQIKELASEITDGLETPYEKTIAITKYLRETIEYSETISSPPSGKDSLEWIIFEYKKAYCVYYASAEILMLRSLGIPARLAVGFSEGERTGNEYVVRRFDAHAWPEVYFSGIGWIEFEPTASQPVLNRPLPPRDPSETNNLSGPINDPLINEENFNFASRDPLLDEAFDPIAPLGQDSSTTNTRYLLPAFVLLILLSVYFNRRYGVVTRLPVFLRNSYEKNGIQTPVWIVNWERWIQASSIQRAFESINFSLNLLGRPLPINATPIERARQLGRILPKAMQNILTLLDEHQTSLYTSREANISQARRAANQIRWLALIERTRYIFEGKPIENP